MSDLDAKKFKTIGEVSCHGPSFLIIDEGPQRWGIQTYADTMEDAIEKATNLTNSKMSDGKELILGIYELKGLVT